MIGLFAEGEDVMKAKEVSSQNSSKLIIGVVGFLIAILVLGSIIYESRKSENWESYTTQNSGLGSNYVVAIAIDSSDRVWIGADSYTDYKKVASVFDGENWETYTPQNSGLVDGKVSAIAIDSSNRVWIGGEGYGVSVFDGENWETYTPQNSGLVDEYFEAFAIDSSDRVWFGSEEHGVTVFDGENWETYSTQNSGLSSDWVDVISIDSSDRLWFVNENGVSVFNGENWETYTPQNSGLGSGYVSAIAFDSSDRVWFGKYNEGVSTFDGENWETYTPQNSGLVSGRISAIAIDSSDRVWIATREHGVSVFDGENWETYTEENSDILSDRVETIAADKQGFMWIGTNKGINRVPIGDRLQIDPSLISISDLFFSRRLSLWLNLIVLVILGNVAIIFVDRRKAMDELEPTEENRGSKRRLALRGAAGGVTASVIVLLCVRNHEIKYGGLEDLLLPFFLYGAVLLAIPVSLVLVGPVAGIVGGRVFKTKKVAFLSGFLALLILELPIILRVLSN